MTHLIQKKITLMIKQHKPYSWGKINLIHQKKKLVLKIKSIKKPNPHLPKVTSTQSKILQVVAERGEVVGGSFAQKVLYPDSREFRDIDIISPNPRKTAANIQSRLNVFTTTEVGRHGKCIIKHKGQVLADVVPLIYYEKYIKKSGNIPTRNVNGIKVLKENILYREKIKAMEHNNQRIQNKLKKDIEFLEK
jgi:hypothetical protein